MSYKVATVSSLSAMIGKPTTVLSFLNVLCQLPMRVGDREQIAVMTATISGPLLSIRARRAD
jgi:hypothetical protein